MSFDLYSQESEARVGGLQPVTKPDPGAFEGFFRGAGMGAMRTMAEHARAGSLIINTLAADREASITGNFLRHENPEPAGGKPLSMLNTVLGGLLAIALIAWGLSYPIKDEMRLRQLQRENQKFEPAIEALRREENQLQQLNKEVSALADLQGRRGEVLRVLDELSKVVPNNAHLSNLRYRAGVLEVQGNAENASALIPLLERSPVFENVAFNAPSNRGRDNRETFSLKAEVEKFKEPAKEPPPQATKAITKEAPKEAPKPTPKESKSKS